MLISSIIECIMILVVIPLGYSEKGEGHHKLWLENSEDINNFDRSIFTPEILSNILSGLISISRSIPNEKCQSEVIEYLDKLSNFKLWAVQMFDATSKFPMGVLQGAAYNLGNFDECLDVDNGANITGRYCLARVEFNSLKWRASDAGTAWEKLRVSGDSRKVVASNDRMKMRRNVFYHGVCFPSSCGASDVEYWLNTVLTTFQSSTQTKFRVEVSESMCQKKDELSEPLNVSQIVWLCIFMYVIVIIWSTLSDLPLKNNCEELQKGMTCKRSFSLLRNWRQLTKQVDQDGDQFIACIDGLRVYTLIIIIIGHRGEAITSGPLINGNAVEQYYEEIGGAMIMNGHLVVDTFFTIGGFVLGWNSLQALQKDKSINLFILYINRYIRLTPAYMTVVAFEAWFLYDMSSGPLWKNKVGRERDNCLNNWWTNALHINNYVQAEFPCIDPAWFIACDVQMFLCAPLFMILLVNNRRLGVAMLSLAIVASVVLPFTITYVYNLDPTIIADPSTLGHTSTTKTYLSTYITTYCRCGPYLVGMLAAHWLYNMRTNKANIGKITLWLGWVFSPLVAVAIIAMGYEFYQPSIHLGRFGNALYSGMHRTTFGACTSFIIVACATGNGGVVARILEWKMLRPFSRLSYSVFLVHTVVQMVHYAAIRSPEYMNNTRMVWTCLSDMILSLIFALVLNLTIERPLMAFWNELSTNIAYREVKDARINFKNGSQNIHGKRYWKIFQNYFTSLLFNSRRPENKAKYQ